LLLPSGLILPSQAEKKKLKRNASVLTDEQVEDLVNDMRTYHRNLSTAQPIASPIASSNQTRHSGQILAPFTSRGPSAHAAATTSLLSVDQSRKQVTIIGRPEFSYLPGPNGQWFEIPVTEQLNIVRHPAADSPKTIASQDETDGVPAPPAVGQLGSRRTEPNIHGNITQTSSPKIGPAVPAKNPYAKNSNEKTPIGKTSTGQIPRGKASSGQTVAVPKHTESQSSSGVLDFTAVKNQAAKALGHPLRPQGWTGGTNNLNVNQRWHPYAKPSGASSSSWASMVKAAPPPKTKSQGTVSRVRAAPQGLRFWRQNISREVRSYIVGKGGNTVFAFQDRARVKLFTKELNDGTFDVSIESLRPGDVLMDHLASTARGIFDSWRERTEEGIRANDHWETIYNLYDWYTWVVEDKPELLEPRVGEWADGDEETEE